MVIIFPVLFIMIIIIIIIHNLTIIPTILQIRNIQQTIIILAPISFLIILRLSPTSQIK